MTATAEGTRSTTVPSAEELSRITLGIGEGCGPVESLGMNLGHVEELTLSRAVEWAQWARMGTSTDSAPQPVEIEAVVNG